MSNNIRTRDGGVFNFVDGLKVKNVDIEDYMAGQSATNLTTTVTATTVNINSSTGSDATIPVATSTEAGVMSAADKVKLSGINLTAKQDTLVSGTNIKTLNGASILGSGDIVVGAGASSAANVTFSPVGNLAATNVQAAVVELDSEKQPTLVSGTNIKTINNLSILGSGNIDIASGAATAASVTFTPTGNILATNVQTALVELDSEKQSTLVSGTSIKTINGISVLGSGNITVEGGTGVVPVKFLTDFGAKGDGLSSSVAANNAAIASALTYIHSTGFNVIVPPGTYICDPFEINYIGYAGQGTFIGIDRERCIFKRSLSSQGPGAFVTIGNPTNQSFQAGMGMSKITIDGGFTTNGPAISIFSAARSRFEECHFAGGSIACNIDFNITVTFATCIFSGSKIGIKIVNSNLLHFEGGEIVENTEIGMWVSGNRMISVSNVDVEGNGTTLGALQQGGIYIGPNMGQDVAINDASSIGLIVDSCWFEANKGLADIHVKSGITSIERSTFFSTSSQTTNDIRIEGGRYIVRSVNSSFTKTNNLYESSNVENGNIIMSSDLPGLNYNPMKTTVYGNSTIAMRGGSVPVATNILKPLIQGGSSTADANGLLTVTFTTAYQFVPTAITCTPIDTIPGTLVGCSITGASTTGFTAQIDYMGQSTTNPVVGSNMLISWISIGSGY